jgi:hypothetical protein
VYEDLAAALVAPAVERAHVLVEAQLTGLASETERGCGARLAVLAGVGPSLAALRARFDALPAWLRAPSGAAAVGGLLADLIARLPELSGVVAAARAMAAVGRADPIRGQALADGLAHQRAALRAEFVGAGGDDGRDDAAAPLSERAQDVLAARDRALAAIGEEADRIAHAAGALDELSRVG